jgi:membrane associated rhomboid family serine protease
MFDNINTRSVTFNLIAINVIMFIVANFMAPQLYNLLSLFYFDNPAFKPLQIVTHMFMHGQINRGGIFHIFFNMFGLFMIGSILERVWGPQRFLLFYFSTGLGAVILHIAVQALIVYNFTGSITPTEQMIAASPGVAETYYSHTVGASGAIFGILIAFGMLFPNTELYIMFIPIPVKAKYFVIAYVAFELYRGITMQEGDNVAHFAHLGGALFGYLLVKYWNRNTKTFY